MGFSRTGGSDSGGTEAAEGLRARAEETVQRDERAGEEAPSQDQRADKGAQRPHVWAAEPAPASACRLAQEPQTRR